MSRSSFFLTSPNLMIRENTQYSILLMKIKLFEF